MSTGHPLATRLRELGRPFLRFCVVGAVGFAIDAGLLLLLLHVQHFTPVSARLVSFSAAVLATFELNRRWTFEVRHGSYVRLLAGYLGVQGLGFLCNVALYIALTVWLPPPLNQPLLCLAIASGAALLVNFVGGRLIVFPKTTNP